jgi:hypothetical protein
VDPAKTQVAGGLRLRLRFLTFLLPVVAGDGRHALDARDAIDGLSTTVPPAPYHLSAMHPTRFSRTVGPRAAGIGWRCLRLLWDGDPNRDISRLGRAPTGNISPVGTRTTLALRGGSRRALRRSCVPARPPGSGAQPAPQGGSFARPAPSPTKCSRTRIPDVGLLGLRGESHPL